MKKKVYFTDESWIFVFLLIHSNESHNEATDKEKKIKNTPSNVLNKRDSG